MKRILFTLLVTLSINANANGCYPTYKATVTYVSDGDTINVMPTGKNAKQITIRLADINAPEKSNYGSKEQPYSLESKALLTKLILNQTVTITPHAKDQYSRTVGTVEYKSINVNKYMVENGAAWFYAYYAIDTDILLLQQQAQANKLGLWAFPNPIEPSEWKKLNP
jgi:micrococcal nuclease